MQNFQSTKSKWRRALESKPVLIILALALIFFAWNTIGFMGKMRETAQNRKYAEEKVKELQVKKQQLSSDISRLGTQEGIEASIREKFGLAKPGEGVIVIIDDKNAPVPAPVKKPDFWDFLKNLFK